MESFRAYLQTRAPEQKRKFLKILPTLRADAGNSQEFCHILTNVEFIEAKLREFGIQPLIDDYDLASHPKLLENPSYTPEDAAEFKQIQEALRLSANVFVLDERRSPDPYGELLSQLWAHLSRNGSKWVEHLLNHTIVASSDLDNPVWLRPLQPTLALPGGSQQRTLSGHLNNVTAVAVSPDGTKIVSAGMAIMNGSCEIKVWEFASGVCLHTLEGQGKTITSLLITPDGQKIIAGSGDGAIYIWNLEDGDLLHTLVASDQDIERQRKTLLYDEYEEASVGMPGGYSLEVVNEFLSSNSVCSLAILPSHQLLIAGYEDTRVRGWSLQENLENRYVGSLFALNNQVLSLAVSHDGVWLAAGTQRSKSIILFHTATQEYYPIQVKPGGSGRDISVLLFSPDNQRLIASVGSEIQIWDVSNVSLLMSIRNSSPSGNVCGLAMTPDGGKILSSYEQGNTVFVWDAYTGEELSQLKGHSWAVISIAVTPDGRYAISGSKDYDIKVWRIDSLPQPQLAATSHHEDEVLCVVVSPDGRHAVTSSYDETIKIWDLADQKSIDTLRGHESRIDALVLSMDGQQLFSGDSSEKINVWDLATKQVTHELIGCKNLVSSLVVMPDGKQLLSGSWDNLRDNAIDRHTLLVWDIQKLRREKGWLGKVFTNATQPERHYPQKSLFNCTYRIEDIAISSDGKWLVAGNNYENLDIWNLETNEYRNIRQDNRFGTPIAITPDNKWLVVSFMDWLAVLRLETGELLFYLHSQDYGRSRAKAWENTDIAVSPDGKYVAATSINKYVRVWSLDTERLLATFTGEASFCCCAITPDSRTIVAGDQRGQLHFLTLEGHTWLTSQPETNRSDKPSFRERLNFGRFNVF